MYRFWLVALLLIFILEARYDREAFINENLGLLMIIVYFPVDLVDTTLVPLSTYDICNKSSYLWPNQS